VNENAGGPKAFCSHRQCAAQKTLLPQNLAVVSVLDKEIHQLSPHVAAQRHGQAGDRIAPHPSGRRPQECLGMSKIP